MNRFSRIAAIVAAIFVVIPATAQVLVSDPANTPVADRKFRYLDLMRLALPGLLQDGEGYRTGKPLELRHISGDKDQRAEIAAGRIVREPIVMLVRSGERRRVVMMLDLGRADDSGEGVALLALFDIEQQPTLLDIANVAYDRQTGFFDPGQLLLRDGSASLLIASGHWNSNQSYQTYGMVDLRGDRLRLIDSFFLFSDNGCGFARSQRPAFAVAGSRAKPAIQVAVTETVTRREESCDGQPLPRPGKRKVSVTYTWQAKDQRFVKSSDALERLAKEAGERF